ncbi:NTP transferase domain-containing protein [Jiulongibacter sediminis]|uniref:NTP transferase domain-containing protein n=1 Tax=Jiulongibacter sediminis TaxID=1605367 RepID=UPI0009E9D9C4|nr:NTP transferase domain-containing protein [Jiulongibacter sediminis]
MKKHQKHTKLSKPEIGNFGRNELSLVGAPCGEIQELAAAIIEGLNIPNSTYIDADHSFGDSEEAGLRSNELTDKIKYFRFDKQDLNDFDKKILLNDQELVLVNGNHFQANKQLVLIHPKKEASLKKRLDQLTNVKGFILCDGMGAPFEWLKDLQKDKPVLRIDQKEEIVSLVKRCIETPVIKGLVLAGGKSTRMGEDKGQIDYHGLPQVDYLLKEFEKVKIEALVSCRPDQYPGYNCITDKFEGLGPFGAIASAFQSDPNAAWLVVACDLPLVNTSVFEELISKRNLHKIATAFHNLETNFPDPLITLWEPKAYMRLMEFLTLGYSCPRKVLINSDIEEVQPENPAILKNVNTPEEREEFELKV